MPLSRIWEVLSFFLSNEWIPHQVFIAALKNLYFLHSKQLHAKNLVDIVSLSSDITWSSGMKITDRHNNRHRTNVNESFWKSLSGIRRISPGKFFGDLGKYIWVEHTEFQCLMNNLKKKKFHLIVIIFQILTNLHRKLYYTLVSDTCIVWRCLNGLSVEVSQWAKLHSIVWNSSIFLKLSENLKYS